MKKLYFLFFIFIISQTFGQPPQKMSYQAVVRDVNNQLVVNQQVGIKISIIKTLPTGLVVYSETHQVTTNGNGLMSLEIGTGIPLPGDRFENIDWKSDKYFIQSNIDITGGTNYTLLGVQELITVPYSFVSETFLHGDYENLINTPAGNNTGDILFWNRADSSWYIIPIGAEGEVLSVGPNNIPRWSTPSGSATGSPPTVTTDSVLNVTGRTADVAANIVNRGSTGVIASGVCWSTTNQSPTLGNNYTTDGANLGTFFSNITGLTPNKIVYVCAYATNSVGTSYGQPISFTTPDHCGIVTDYDNNVYQTIYIGNQCWMKENLKTTHYFNGTAIYAGVAATNSSYPYMNSKYYYRYGDVDSNIAIYGLLYSWAAVMNGAASSNANPSRVQGICPLGWHVPSNAEWCEMENYVEPWLDYNCNTINIYRGSSARKYTLAQYWRSNTNNPLFPGYWHVDTLGSNETGFSAKPGGYYYYSQCSGSYVSQANYAGIETSGYWWSSTTTSASEIYYRYISSGNFGIYLTTVLNTSTPPSGSGCNRHYAYSVRCVKN